MKLSIAYELYMNPNEVKTEYAMKTVSDAGFEYADMSIGPFCLDARSPILKSDWKKWAQETKETAIKNNINMLQAHCLLFDYSDKNAPDHQYLTDVNMKLLDVCSELGITYMIFHPATDHRSPTVKSSLNSTLEWILPFVEKAERSGLRICMENVFDDICDKTLVRAFGARPDELGELVEKIGSKNVGVCWDSGHAHISMIDQRESLNILGDKVWTTHIHDNRGQYANDLHLPPFYGSICWQDVMQGLRDIDYKGTLNFEIAPCTVPLDYMCEELKSVYKKGERLLQMF